MSDAELFDAFYADSRDRVLTLAYALTGDLPASRGAVRDSYVAAWHHWSKLKRMDDPETWVRPHAWSHAQRRHTARIWHRDRKLDPEVRATLDALAKLSVPARKTLLLSHLTSASHHELASEVGLSIEDAETRLQEATTEFASQRSVSADEVRPFSTAWSRSAPGSAGRARPSSGAPAPRAGVRTCWSASAWSSRPSRAAGSSSPTTTASTRPCRPQVTG